MFALVAMECKSGERGHKQYSHIITKFLKYDVFGSNKFRKCLIDHACHFENSVASWKLFVPCYCETNRY